MILFAVEFFFSQFFFSSFPMAFPSTGCPLPSSYNNIYTYTNALCDFIQQYRFLTNIHVVDFLTNDQWNLLDPEWRQALLPVDGATDDSEWWDSLIHLSTAADTTKVINIFFFITNIISHNVSNPPTFFYRSLT